MPTVSVIIPTYNRRAYVQEAIDSVLAQTYTDYEIIVIDDGSTDSTGETLRERYGDKIIYEWQENQGESVARNRGIALAQGEYIAFLDSDDLWLPEKLQKQVAYLEEHPEVGAVFAEASLMDADGEPLPGDPLGGGVTEADLALEALCFSNAISGPSTVAVRKAVLAASDGFKPALRYGEDWDLWLRIRRQSSMEALHEPLARLRRHAGTQCYYPDAERNAPRLEDHLTLLTDAFERWPGAVPLGLRERALGYQYAQAFLWEWSVGNREAAERDLARVLELHPALLSSEERFGRHVVNQIAAMAESDRKGIAAAVDQLESLTARLRGLGDTQALETIQARALQTLAYQATLQSRPVLAARLFVSSLIHDVHLPGKRGMVSHIARACGRRLGAVGLGLRSRFGSRAFS